MQHPSLELTGLSTWAASPRGSRAANLLSRFRHSLSVLSLGLTLTSILAQAAAPQTATPTDRPPNIILILADDVGCDWISCYDAAHRTPNIDKLADHGVRFQTAWCTPLCSPTRVELLTGRYPFRTGWTDHHDVPRWGGKGLDWDRETTFAHLLKQAGYATALAGKWQINDLRQFPDALKRHGFDEHCLWPGYETGNAPPSDERYWNAYLQTNGKREICTNRFGPDVVNDFALDFIRRHRDQPFLLYYPMILCHTPYPLTPFNRTNPPHGQKQIYGDLITYIDYQVGTILRTVEDLGLSNRTLIIFTGDNGSSTGGERGGKKFPPGKGQTSNVGVQVPFLVQAPWLARAGQVVDTPMDFTDVLPTLSEIGGARVPKGLTLDGHSLVPLLKGISTPDQKRAWIFSERGKNRTVRNERWKLDSTGRFWDINNDPFEQSDLSRSTVPEIAQEREKLRRLLESLPADGPPPFPGFLQVPGRDTKE
jgi:arylsulfatase A-like enzyme